MSVTENDPGACGLHTLVEQALQDYLQQLNGTPPNNLYDLILQEVEKPLLQTVLQHTRHNQTRAAAYLGINRGTLRKKLKQYDLES